MFFTRKRLLKLVTKFNKRAKTGPEAPEAPEAPVVSENRTKREWRYAWVISIAVHVLVLVAWLWSYERLAEPENLVVELRSRPTPSRAAAASSSERSTRTETKSAVKKTSTNVVKELKTQKTSVTEKANEVKRELNLVRPTRAERPETPRVTSEPSFSKPNRELTLTRSSRYVAGGSAGKISPEKSSAAGGVVQKKNLLPQSTGGGGQSAGVPRTAAGKLSGTGASGQARGQAQTGTQSTSRSSFNWKDGREERTLLAKQQSPLPERLRHKGIQAQTVVNFKVDKSGRTYSVELIKSSGYHELDDWTTRYVRTFRFNRVENRFVYQAEYTQWFKP